MGQVKCIKWFDDDSGFISGGWDGFVNYQKLYKDDVGQYHQKNMQFTCVANKPDSKEICYVAANDKSVREVFVGFDRNEKNQDKNKTSKCTLQYDAGVNISQLVLLNGARALIAGVHENDKPGSIQVINMGFEKIFEVQAHSLPIERLRLSYDNQYLYSAGQDGMLGIFQIMDKKDRDL